MQKINVTAKDGAVIPAITIGIEDENKKAVVIISHGFGEHSGSYVELAEELYSAGYASIIPDQRGHGKPPDGAKKWLGIIPGYMSFVDDIVSLTETARELAPDTPIALYGHSMGGNIVVNTLLRIPKQQSASYFCAVLESPWLWLYDPPNPVAIWGMKILSHITPNIRQNRSLKSDDLSSDAERSDGYAQDPLYHGYISIRMASGILSACDYAMENAARFPVPTLLAYAKNELVVCNKTILKFAEKAGDKITLKEYDSNHAIHNDDKRESYGRDVIAYLDSKLP